MNRHTTTLSEALPDMKGLSPRDLEYMSAYAAAWPERAIVQESLAQNPPSVVRGCI